MSRAAGIIAALRSATIVAAGAIAVHQVRYLVGHGGDAARALEGEGHAYIGALMPILALLAGLTVLGTVFAGIAGLTPSRRRAPVARTLLYAGAILAVFGAQEIIEGAVVAAHPTWLAAVTAHGGLVALPLAFAFGWLVWAAVSGLETLEERLRARHSRAPRAPRATRARALELGAPPLVALATGAPPRAPPSA